MSQQELIGALFSALSLAAVYFVVTAGLTMIFGMLRLANFAHGAMYMAGSYIGFTVGAMASSNLGFVLALVFTPLIMAVVGFVIERSMLQWIYRKELPLQFLLTFGIALVLADLIRIQWGADFRNMSVPDFAKGAWTIGGTNVSKYTFVLIAAGLVVAVGLWAMLYLTKLGLIIRAAVADREMAGALGVNVPVLFTTMYMLGVALSALGGALIAPTRTVHLAVDVSILVEAFVVITVAGLGSLKGALIAALLIGLARSYGVLFEPLVPGQISVGQVMIYVVMIAVLIVRPWGLYGEREA